MKFLKQVRYEIRNIIKSRFLLIFALILLFLSSVALPIAQLVFGAVSRNGGGFPGPRPMPIFDKRMAESVYYGGGDGQDPIVVNGVTIAIDNPFYWNVQGLIQQKKDIEIDKNRFSKPEAMDMAIEMIDEEIAYFVRFAGSITKYNDYRIELAWRGVETMWDKYIYENLDAPEDVLLEAVSFRKGMDYESFKKKYLDVTAAERQQAYQKTVEMLDEMFAIVDNNDFAKYVDVRIRQENDQIAVLKDNIEIQKKAIIDNPSQEDQIDMIIKDMEKQIRIIETNNIPILKYRLEKNIVPGEDIWQNVALSDVENNRNQIEYTTILDEDKFNQETWLVQQYKTYQRYRDAMQKQINKYNDALKIAQSSLDAGKPDMKYVPGGLRSRIVAFLDFSVLSALFAVLLGGWIMASEFQQGTIRLLMIRPKTRVKVLMAKFTAAFVLCLAFYLAGSLISAVVNGICFGFSDLAFPNYTINGPVGFLADYLPKMLISAVPLLFGFCVAFMLSVIVRNSAISIAVPIVCFVACIIALGMFAFRPDYMAWLQYTPVPFVWMSGFFVPNSIVQSLMLNSGTELSLGYGIGLLTVLAAVSMAAAVLVFRKRDITN